jgi:hypothetical protein
MSLNREDGGNLPALYLSLCGVTVAILERVIEAAEGVGDKDFQGLYSLNIQ